MAFHCLFTPEASTWEENSVLQLEETLEFPSHTSPKKKIPRTSFWWPLCSHQKRKGLKRIGPFFLRGKCTPSPYFYLFGSLYLSLASPSESGLGQLHSKYFLNEQIQVEGEKTSGKKEKEREAIQALLEGWNPDLYSSWGARGIEWCVGTLLLARSPLLPEETWNAVFLQTFPGGDGSRSQAPSSSKEKGTGCGSSNLRDNKNQNPRHLEQHRPKTLFHIQWLTQLNKSLKRVLELHPSCPIASSFGFLSTRDALSKRGGLDGFKTCPHLLFQLHKAPQVCGGWNGQSWWRAILHRPRALPGQRQSVQRMARSGARWAGRARGRVASAPTSKTRVGAVCASTEGSRLTAAEPSTRTPVPLWRLLPPKGGPGAHTAELRLSEWAEALDSYISSPTLQSQMHVPLLLHFP